MELKKEYLKDDFAVVWKPGLCQHAGICVKMLPQVYNPKEKPWIKPDNATVEELKAQIDKCPSGALSYYSKSTPGDDQEYELIDNKDAKEYQFKIGNATARIEYIKTKDRIFLTHTEVPKSLEGKGIGSLLIKRALMDIEKKDITLVPLCPFVAQYIKKHPEWKKLVLKGINIS